MKSLLLTLLMTLALAAPVLPHGHGKVKQCCKGKEAKCEQCAKMAEGNGGGCCKKARNQQDSAGKAAPSTPKQ